MYPGIATAGRRQKTNRKIMLDGEIVVLDQEGRRD